MTGMGSHAALGLGIVLLAGSVISGARGAGAIVLGVSDEIDESATGDRVVRSVTLGPRPGARASLGRAHAAGAGGQVLWVDTNHLGAVAQNIAITGQGDHVAVGWWLNGARAALYATGGSGVPEWTFAINTTSYVPVDASNDGGIITATGRQDLLYAWDAASNIPVCVAAHVPGHEGVAAYTPAVGGSFAGSSALSNQASSTHAHTGAGCTQRFVDPAMPGQVQGGRYAAAGEWVAVNSRSMIQVYEDASGSVRGTAPIPGETQAAVGVSGDGSLLADGGFAATLYVYRWNGTAYEELWTHAIPDITWITAVDVSDDGSTIMVGTWLSPELGRVLMYDVAAGPTPLWTNSDFGDYIAAVELDEDGSRGIAGSWGRLDTTFGHVIAVFDRSDPAPVFAVGDDEIPGVSSCFAVDISNDGTRLAAGGKAVHARALGSGGYALALGVAEPTSVGGDPVAIERGLVLGQARPNPSVRSVTIPYAIGESARIRLTIFDGAGRTVRGMDLGGRASGSHRAVWDGRDESGRRVPGGVYFCSVEARRGDGLIERTDARRVVVLQ